jgi:hypothetical protein
MATTIEQIQEFLDDRGLNYAVNPSADAVLVGFQVPPDEVTYRDLDGDPYVALITEVSEDGEFLRVFAPAAWSLSNCIHKTAVLAMLPAIQARLKLLRFDYSAKSGHLKPNVELPIEDGTLTQTQFERAFQTVLRAIHELDAGIRRVMQTGKATPEDLGDGPAPSLMEHIAEGLAAEVGGPESLERLITGEGPAVGDDEARTLLDRIMKDGTA